MSRAPEIVLTEGNGFTTIHPETEGEKQVSGSSGGFDPRLKNLVIWIIALLVMLYVVMPMILSATCAYTGGFGCEAIRRLNASHQGIVNRAPSFGGDVGSRYGSVSPTGQVRWGPKTRTNVACGGRQRGEPFDCGSASPSGLCICP